MAKTSLAVWIVLVLVACMAVPALGAPVFGPEAQFEGKLTIYLQAYAPRERRATDRWDPPQYAWQIAADYQKIHPKVEIEFLDETSTGENYDTWLRTRLIGRNAPDIFWVQNFDANQTYGPQGLLVDLREYLSLPNPYAEGFETWGDVFTPQTWDPVKGPNGEHYVIVGDVVVTPWFYNKDIFAAVGLDPDRTPETLCEWLNMMDKIKAAGYVPIAWAGAGSSGEMYWEWLSRTIFHSIYRGRVDEMDVAEQPGFINLKERIIALEKGIINVDSPEYRAGWELMYRFAQYFQPSHLSDDEEMAYEQWVTGKAAMFWGGSWQLKPILYDSLRQFDFGTFHFPLITKACLPYATADKVGLMGGPTAAFQYAIPSHVTGRQRELAVDFLMFLTAPQNAGPFIQDAGLFAPGIKGVEPGGETGPMIANMMPGPNQEFLELINRDPGAVLLTLECRQQTTRLFQQYVADRLTLDQVIQQLKSIHTRTIRQLISENQWDLSEYLK
ncbi:MAG TPA: extracellular solute-binding protein [Firmicutes bacterium]|nr:extracellular solute-binding protein [Bacillota bacterium]